MACARPGIGSYYYTKLLCRQGSNGHFLIVILIVAGTAFSDEVNSIPRMAAWLDGRKVCLVLPLLGLLLFCFYSIMLKEPKTRYNRMHFANNDDILFDLEVNINKSTSDEYKLSTHMWYSRTRTNDTVTRERSLLRRRLPNSIIIGVRKGGTRALLEFLKIHPRIKACAAEVHFFDNNKNYQLGLNWYRRQMPESRPEDITIEKTPAYFVTAEAPERVYKMSPTIKLIVIVRDPTERAISDYVQVSFKKHGMLPPFEKFITEDEEQKVLRTSIGTVQIGVYTEHLRNWLKHFPISQLHFASMEELTTNPAKELQAVEKFLNIEPFIKKDHFYINQTKRFPCFSGYVDGKKKRNSGCLSESKGRPHPSVRDDIRKLLQDYYRPYNEKLYKEVQRDFRWP